jgi:hypothetical protein
MSPVRRTWDDLGSFSLFPGDLQAASAEAMAGVCRQPGEMQQIVSGPWPSASDLSVDSADALAGPLSCVSLVCIYRYSALDLTTRPTLTHKVSVQTGLCEQPLARAYGGRPVCRCVLSLQPPAMAPP